MRKICCFCESWESGGIESFLNNILGRMDLGQLRVDIVCAELRPSVFTEPLQARGVRFVPLSGSMRHVAENSRLFRALLEKERYDVVHLHLFQGLSLRLARQARAAGVPLVIAHSHNTALRKSRGRALKLLLHRAGSLCFSSCAHELWACSGAAAEFLFPGKLLARKGYTFIPNGIRTERFRFRPEGRQALRESLGLSDAFVLGHIGRLCYQKNQAFLLEVLAELVKLRPESRLLLVGEGDDETLLRARAGELGLEDRVLFYGTTDKPEELLWAMDAFAFPSRFEGLGIVAVEAQAAGLPLLCSEHVPPEARVLDNARVLPLTEGAGTWARTLAEPDASERTAAAERVAERFELDRVARMIEEIYQGQ